MENQIPIEEPSTSSSETGVDNDAIYISQVLSLEPISEDEKKLIKERVFNIVYFPTGEFICFEPDSYSLISRHFRIFGSSVTATGISVKRNPKHPNAPILFEPEAVSLLQEIGHAKIFRYSNEITFNSIQEEILANEKMLEQDEKMLKRARSATIGLKRKEIYQQEYADVPKAKRPKIPDDAIPVTEEEVLSKLEELISNSNRQNQTPLISRTDLLISMDSSCFPKNDDFRRRNIVYRDIWKRGYYLSSGLKFACHYLVYDGIPNDVHSSYLCHVLSSDASINLDWMQLHGRIAKSVKKEILLAFVNDFGEVYYQRQSYWNEAAEGKGIPKRIKPLSLEGLKPEIYDTDLANEIIDKSKKDSATCWEDLDK